jgi:hypothetical protein
MKHRFLIWILTIFSSCFCFILISSIFKNTNKEQAQFSYLKYDVEIEGKNVGWMTSRKSISESNPNITNFLIDSKVMFNVITTYTIQLNSLSTFKNNNLFYANYITKVNGDTQSFSTINWDGSKYIGWSKNQNTVIPVQKIVYSIGNIYYKEPIGQTQIFSEKHMEMCPISKTGDFYTVSFSDGKSTMYKYQNGICVWAETKQRLYKITFRLKEIK